MPPTLGYCFEMKRDHTLGDFRQRKINENWTCKYCGKKMEMR